MFRSLAVFTVLAAFPAFLSAQTLDEVIARHLEARGGIDRVMATKTLRMTGRITIGAEGSGPFSLELKRPNKMRVEFILGGQAAVQAFDGTRGWVVMPFAGINEPQFQPPGEPRELAEQADIDGPLLDYHAKGARVDLIGKVRVGAGEAWKLRMTLRAGVVRFLFIDVKTGYLVRAEERRRVGEGDMTFANSFSDHRKVHGLVLPFRVESAPEGSSEKQVLVFDSIEVDAPIEESRFAVPAGAKPAAKPVGEP
jgi:hypothetical protein